MKIEDLKLSTSIFIDVERNAERFSLVSKVQDNFKGGVMILAPVVQGSIFTFRPGDSLFIRSTVDSRLLRWQCTKWELAPVSGIQFLKLFCDNQGESYNRREAYRVTLGLSVKYKVSGDEIIDLILKDVSLTGVGFTSRKELTFGDSLAFSLSSDIGDIPLAVQIVRIVPPKEGEKEFSYGAIFLSNDNPRLQRFVSAKQMDELRKRRQQR